jgi:hypothetical protein
LAWLAWATITVAMTGGAVAKARHALLIANQAYKPAVGRLENPLNDVRLIASALEQVGFSTTILTDATRTSILAAVDAYADRLQRAGKDAIGFFYFSGHGAANARDGRNYLIPVTANSLDDTVWYDSVPLDRITGTLTDRAANAAHFIVFDACRNVLRLRTRGGQKGFRPAREQTGLLIAFSTKPGDTATDEGEGAGPYAKALAAEIVRPGQHHLDLFQNVRERVYSATRNAQIPWDRNGLLQRVYLSDRDAISQDQQQSPTSQQRTRDKVPAPEGPKSAAPACTVIARNIPRRIELQVGQRFCDNAGLNEAVVLKIENRIVVFSDNGVRKSCRQGELCGFNWPSVVPMFRISARADAVKGIKPAGVMLPR